MTISVYILHNGIIINLLLFVLIFKGDVMQNEAGQSALHCLEQAAIHYATAIKFRPQNPKLHLLLGQTLEEYYYAKEMYGLKKVSGAIF